MTIDIPPDATWQAIAAFLAGLTLVSLGLIEAGRMLHFHDVRAERTFLLGACLVLGGVAWIVAGVAIVLGELYNGHPAQEDVMALVVFTNAVARIAILGIGARILWVLADQRRHPA